MNKRKIGAYGERLAIAYFEKMGYHLIGQNIFTPYGEIDLIMTKGSSLHFIEVKYRKNMQFGHPSNAMTPQKIKHFYKSVMHYLSQMQGQGSTFQLGFIGIVKEGTEGIQYDYIENIFS